MKISIGLVGPQDTIELVQQVGRERAERLQLIPFQYVDVEEVPELIKHNAQHIDIWLFTGRVAYEVGRSYAPKSSAIMIRLSGSALMKALFNVIKENGIPEKFSIDTFTGEEVEETLNELHLDREVAMIYPENGYIPSSVLIEFHESMYRSGKVNACITARGHVYEELIKRGVSVFRIIPTIMSIRETLRLAIQLGETNYFRHSQIAALLIHIDNIPRENSNSYETYRLNLKLQELLIEFAEHITGALIPTGGTTFSLFSTRGAIEQSNCPPALLFEKIRLLSGGTVHFGIGYGLTAFGAEQNAVLAQSRTNRNEEGGLVIIDETGAIHETSPQQEPLSYHYISDDMAVIERLKQAGVSTATFNRMVSVQNRTGKRALTAADLASWLDMTQRNANRLLSELQRSGLARIVGEEAPSTKGRPRKLFHIEVVGEVEEAELKQLE